MRKAAFHSIVGLSMAICAVCLGIMLTKYLSLRAYSAKPPRVSAEAPEQTNAFPPPENWTNLFAPSAGMRLPSRLPAVAAIMSDGKAVSSRSNFVLLGTIVSTRPDDSRAVLWADGMKQPKLVRVNTMVEPGAILTSVTRDKAIIDRGAAQEHIDLLPIGSKSRAPSAGIENPPPPRRTEVRPPETPTDNSLRVERIDENSFALDEPSLAHLYGNINQFMTNVRLTPYFEGEVSAGYRIASVRPGTAFDKLGFRNGDVIQNVNGVTLSSPEKLYTIFQNLKDEKMVSVDIVRQGTKNTLKYEIK
ncbi:MAG: PDZ domain-containing protein [Syntrophorhabdaceae bacterium]|nr:PDZ domain-containing protein [Syntrophorhabdaceae bacterium]